MTVANALTFIRIFVSPIFMLVYVEHDLLGLSERLLPYALLFLLIVTEISDFLDGYFARRFNEVTDLGKLLDPMADSLTHIAVFFSMTTGAIQLPILWVFVIFYRESVVTTLRTVCAVRGIALAARMSGKIKAAMQGIAGIVICCLFLFYSWRWLTLQELQRTSALLITAVGIYTVFSGFDYIFANWSCIKGLGQKQHEH